MYRFRVRRQMRKVEVKTQYLIYVRINKSSLKVVIYVHDMFEDFNRVNNEDEAR
jgi:hypothetical protein